MKDVLLAPAAAVIRIVGLPATGKTTLARELSRRLGIPAYSIDEERLPLLRPGQPWPWGRDHHAWAALERKVTGVPVAIVETGGTNPREANVLRDRRVLTIECQAPREVRRKRLAARCADGYPFASGRPDYVEQLLALRPVMRRDVTLDTRSPAAVELAIAACEAFIGAAAVTDGPLEAREAALSALGGT